MAIKKNTNIVKKVNKVTTKKKTIVENKSTKNSKNNYGSTINVKDYTLRYVITIFTNSLGYEKIGLLNIESREYVFTQIIKSKDKEDKVLKYIRKTYGKSNISKDIKRDNKEFEIPKIDRETESNKFENEDKSLDDWIESGIEATKRYVTKEKLLQTLFTGLDNTLPGFKHNIISNKPDLVEVEIYHVSLASKKHVINIDIPKSSFTYFYDGKEVMSTTNVETLLN